MSQRIPLSEKERERIYQGRAAGQKEKEIAEELDCSASSVGKWWRRYRQAGLAGLQSRPRGTRRRGSLVCFEARVKEAALKLKRGHPRWGPDKVKTELGEMPTLVGLKLPSRSQLAVLFKRECAELVRTPTAAQTRPTAPISASQVHEQWQLDCQEGVALVGGAKATICNVRDPASGAMIVSQGFDTQTRKRWRKLEWTEVRQVLRQAFTEWGTLPDRVLTDNELCLAGSPNDPFPSRLTLWLVGLGIDHEFIRPRIPQDQAAVERSHQTMHNFAADAAAGATFQQLQPILDRERFIHNHRFPSRAADCAGRPPLLAHPELLQPRRPFRPEWEAWLFDLQRVANYLACFAFERKANTSGQVSLGRTLYSIGRKWKHHPVIACFDPQAYTWVFFHYTQDPTHLPQIASRPAKHWHADAFTGLSQYPEMPVQRPLFPELWAL